MAGHSRLLITLVVGLLIVLSLGNLTNHESLGFGQGVTKPTNSSRGTEALERHFPAGLGSPLTAVMKIEDAPVAAAAMKRLHSVQLALTVPATPTEAVVLLVLRDDPYGDEAETAVEEIREKLHAIVPGALLGGVPVENLDVEETNARDTKLIVPLVLLVIGLILIGVLRALVAPAYLIATVLASFAATLGLATFAFTEVFGTGGLAFNLELMSFIFLVALGVDYNIFLMTRAREEAAARGTREGVLAALTSTGGVITGAGLILAGTFATLTLLPLEELVQIGATVAVGVLLDTFLVRALLIPAITYRLGDRTWWPGTAPGAGSVTGAALHLLALVRVGAALLLQRLAGFGDVVGEAVDLGAAEGLLDQRPHHLHLLGVGRHRVGGEHPAALGRELPGDVELVVVVLAGELEGDQRQLLLSPRSARSCRSPRASRPRPWRSVHRPHDVRVALVPEADEVVVLGEHHRGAGREVEGEGGVGLAEVVLVEDEVVGQVGLLAEDEPADARVDEPELVAGDVDRAHLLEPEVPLGVRVEEGPDEAAGGGVDVERDVEPLLVFDPTAAGR